MHVQRKNKFLICDVYSRSFLSIFVDDKRANVHNNKNDFLPKAI